MRRPDPLSAVPVLACMLLCVRLSMLSMYEVRDADARNTYGVDGNNLTGGLLHLSELTNEVPETRLGDRLVDGEDPHAVELGRGLLLGGKVASNHHVLSEASHLEDCVGVQVERVVAGKDEGSVDWFTRYLKLD